jgi:hypothetical protein
MIANRSIAWMQFQRQGRHAHIEEIEDRRNYPEIRAVRLSAGRGLPAGKTHEQYPREHGVISVPKLLRSGKAEKPRRLTGRKEATVKTSFVPTQGSTLGRSRDAISTKVTLRAIGLPFFQVNMYAVPLIPLIPSAIFASATFHCWHSRRQRSRTSCPPT